VAAAPKACHEAAACGDLGGQGSLGAQGDKARAAARLGHTGQHVERICSAWVQIVQVRSHRHHEC
jgi:hypothetical protein